MHNLTSASIVLLILTPPAAAIRLVDVLQPDTGRMDYGLRASLHPMGQDAPRPQGA
ncbi:hypothetical protein MA5S0422_3138 [Mycobacteroides abscessus 5S-0422]|nr:hypothetical protein MA5S0421_2460 [Mycobacteroides abscessus 5S-0421]EIU10547.1 hypothetical protein MA5S0304_2205 [Mycobacteroides abscessus 5S-0304]EIU14073.1 hypothetical protein MA5S0422_3138 [Mycobacteroides abscessus 5S-0422]EIU22823.1 hypothetical protein MA5S0708_5227 [Mycobacteroides abscessus 5S-0708]EIU26558.1 hypothetical protein MA5S0817_1751 [Mycobacteroides abscessus 5S-0817]EIU32171.1 hypothetical protein MA5S1212_1889 [Mycobacteroides abscessus 5S-1212]EIU43016.1 hypothet